MMSTPFFERSVYLTIVFCVITVLPHDVFVVLSEVSLLLFVPIVHDGYGSDVVEQFTAGQYVQIVPCISPTVTVASSIIREQ